MPPLCIYKGAGQKYDSLVAKASSKGKSYVNFRDGTNRGIHQKDNYS